MDTKMLRLGGEYSIACLMQKPFAPNTALMSIQLLNIGMILN